MTDGDRSCEVRVRHERKGGGIQNKIQWLECSSSNKSNTYVIVLCKVHISGLSLQQSGVESWQCALLSVERGLLVLNVPGLQETSGLGVRVGINNPGL